MQHPNKHMRKCILFSFLWLLLYSCESKKTTVGGLTPLNGNKYVGGIFRLNELDNVRNMYPLEGIDFTTQRLIIQMYEGLVKFSQADLSILPALAESWTKNTDASVWTFKIRKGVKFQDDECFKGGIGKEVTANDFKWCFDMICTASPHNQMFPITFKDRVKGADVYYRSTEEKKPLTGGVSGIKVLDDYTLEISLLKSSAGFLNILASSGCLLFPKEAYDKYGEDGLRNKCVGTGAFILKTFKEDNALILERNPTYWGKDADGNQLPYLDGVRYSFIKDKKQELLDFRKGELDMVFRLPIENIGDILVELDRAKENKPFELQITPALILQYYGFLNCSKPFNDKRVRLAFNYAIDRKKIVDYTLKGEGLAAIYGVVPPSPSFEETGFGFKQIKGYTFDVDRAKRYIAEAGYPDGKGFPHVTLQINSAVGDRNVLVSQVIQGMLKENLNVEVNIETLPFSQHLDRVENGQALFWRMAWSADYPDPESFLILYYGKNIPANILDRSFVNTTRFRSAQFDSILSLALHEPDERKQYGLFKQADQVVINEGAIMPIYYDEIYRLLKRNIRQFEINALEYRDFSRVYFVPEEKNNQKN